jgi:hypothetical protein
MKKHEFSIAVMLPTRARTDALSRSIFSLIDHAAELDKIQFIIGIDDDDTVAYEHFVNVIQPNLDRRNITYTAIEFERLGYEGLNKYYNTLATHADADWLFVWCDDAIMETKDWDVRIAECTGEFKLLKVHTHNEHPYSIFPIAPAEWYELTGYLSHHQLIDTELSQLAYLLDIMKIIEVDVTHDRVDLTGNNNDDTANKDKKIFEGNPSNPYDFHYTTFAIQRQQDVMKLAEYMQKQGLDTSWWTNVLAGKQDPWENMRKNDPNKQTSQFKIADNGHTIKI